MPDPTPESLATVPEPIALKVTLTYDRAINYAFQQNAIPVVKELLFQNDDKARKDVSIRIASEPAFAPGIELRLAGIDAKAETRFASVDLKLSHDFLASITEKVSGWLKVEATEGGVPFWSSIEAIDLLARNEWCGLCALPEILAAFVLPNDPAVMTILTRAGELLGESTGRSALNGYQDKNRKRAWEQVAAIYKAISDLRILYIGPSASFENTGQKVRFPSDVLSQRFGSCLDLSLLFAACCEQVGLHPFVFVHDGHAYSGCWLEERTLPEASSDDRQHIRKLVASDLITVFETTTVTHEFPGTLEDAELLAKPHLDTQLPFRLALDVKRARISRIHPLPIAGQATDPLGDTVGRRTPSIVTGIGRREIVDPVDPPPKPKSKYPNRIDQWKSQLLDLTLRNRLLNFKETKAVIRILSADPEKVEDELAAKRELSIRPKPKLMGADDPRSATAYTIQQRADAMAAYLRDELVHRRLHTPLEEVEHTQRLTELFRAARTSLEENGANTLYAAVGVLEWREAEHSDRILQAPLLLVPVELKRKSIVDGFSLCRLDEETRLNITLMEMLRQQVQMEIPGLDPLPEDESGINVPRVFQIFRDAVRDLPGWEVKTDIWLAQFSFTKFLLWKDLSDRLDDLTRNRIVRHLIHEAGTQYPNPPGDIQPRELDDQFHPREIFCPLSADSSQLAAVMAAAAGHDFVLEGPPGTGKSQTITNIIAHCLAHGKRVLFVAEKRAALEMVYRRLCDERLQPFCLELHSNKTGKAEVLSQFDTALRFVGSATPDEWEQSSVELERLRTSLNRYTRALHREYPSGLSASACLNYLLPRQGEPFVRLDEWRMISETPAEMLSRARELARRLQERSRPFVPLANHPLSPVAYKNWSPTWEEQTTVSIRDVINLVRLAIDAAVDLRNWLGYPRPEGSRQELAGLAVVARCLQAEQPIGPGFATTPWPQLLNWLDQWFGWAEERSQLRGVLQALHQPTAVTSTSVTSELWSSEVANKIISDAHELKVLTKAATQADKSLRAWLNIPRPTDSREETVSLIGLVDCLLAPMPVGSAFATTPWQEWVSEFDHWILLVKERSELLLRLNEYHVERLLSLDLDTIHRNYRSAQTSGGISRWIRVQFIRRRLRQTRIAQNLPKTETVGPILEAGDRLRAVVGELDGARSKAESLLGTVWANGEPQIDVLHRTRQWGETLNRYIDAVAVADIPWGNQLRQLLARLFGDGPSSYASGSMVGSRLSLYRDAITRFDECYESFFGDADLQRDTPETAPDFLGSVAWIIDTFIATVPRIRAIDAGFTDSAAIANGCLGKLWEGGEPAAEKIASARDWGRQLHSGMVDASHRHAPFLLQLRQKLAALFEAGPGTFGNGTDIRLFLTTFCNTQTAFNENFDYAATAISLRRQSLDTESDYLQTILATLLGLQNAWSKIREWCAWQQARSEGIAMGLTPLIEVLEGPEGDRCDLPTLFEHSFRRSLLFATIENESVLREFFGNEHNDRIAKFRSIDQKVAALARDSILARLAVGIPRDQKDDTIPKTEVGLLRREISKKRAHIPVRQLLAGMPNLLPRLKPCVLMSPLSVAQYLEPSHELFDVVIFDEASQIPVSDAIGAIARGKQLIVVGDPKQLPPTNFFNPNSGDEDEATPEEHKDLESILDELMSLGLRHKRLEWHYRSRHEALIAFSNRQYYANQLLTFPSPTGLLGGVQFVHLPQARYDKGKSRTNPAEAKALVKELVARLRAPATSRSSYGVVTFSVAQQQLIETLLDEERRHFPEIEHHFGEESPTDGEPVFVKNLENVQGDERDIILFSICYGPDETARLSLNFGPLNRDGGERRLNVAITRAKREMVVFSGLTAGQIDLTRTRARGVRDLKYFLDYAERGVKALTAAANASGDSIHESEFERLVAERIRATGYEVHHQVGCSGYRIDLGIVDPGAPGKYLLGVECDGATYHRAATARDRDKLRQLVLEGLGWKLHRIWSTDWWHNPEGEMEKLKAELARLTQRP